MSHDPTDASLQQWCCRFSAAHGVMASTSAASWVSRRGAIVLFGDSITEQSFRQGGWGSALANYWMRRADVLCRGYGGYNTRWALEAMPHVFREGEPPMLVSLAARLRVLSAYATIR